MPNPKRVTINPSEFCTAMMAVITSAFCPDAAAAEPIRLATGLSVEPEKLWRNLGRRIGYDKKFVVDVPTAAAIVSEVRSRVVPRRHLAMEELSRKLYGPPAEGEKPSAVLKYPDLMRALQSGTSEQRVVLLELLYRLQASDVLYSGASYMAAKDMLKRYGGEYQNLPLQARPELDRLNHVAGEIKRFIGFCRMVFDYFYWDRELLPSEAVLRLFPKAFYTADPDEDHPIVLDLGQREIDADSGHVGPELYNFYTELAGCAVKVVSVDGWFKEKERQYVAFLIATPTGRRIAVLEPAQYRDAAWMMVFKRSDDSAGWTAEQITRQHRLFGEEAPSIRRFTHPTGWQERVMNYIASKE